MDLNNNKTPLTLSDCFDILREIMEDSEDKEWFKNCNEDDAVNSTHHGLGEWIRNNWGLWSKKSSLYDFLKKLGLWHADDMSSFILRSYHRHINDKDLDLLGQVDDCIKHWREYEQKFGPTQK